MVTNVSIWPQTDLKTTTVNDPKKWHKSVLYEEMEIPKLAEEN